MEEEECSSNSSGGSDNGGFRDGRKHRKSNSRGFHKPVRIRKVVTKVVKQDEAEANLENFKAAWDASSEKTEAGVEAGAGKEGQVEAETEDTESPTKELFRLLGIEKAIEDHTREGGGDAKTREKLLYAGGVLADEEEDDIGRIGGGSGRIVNRRALLKRTDSSRNWAQSPSIFDSNGDSENEQPDGDGDAEEEEANEENQQKNETAGSQAGDRYGADAIEEETSASFDLDNGAFTPSPDELALPGLVSPPDEETENKEKRSRAATADLGALGVDDLSSGEVSGASIVGSGDVAAGVKEKHRHIRRASAGDAGRIGLISAEWTEGSTAVIEKARADKSIWASATVRIRSF